MYEVSPLDEHNIRLLNNVHPKGWLSPEPAPIYNVVVRVHYVALNVHAHIELTHNIRALTATENAYTCPFASLFLTAFMSNR